MKPKTPWYITLLRCTKTAENSHSNSTINRTIVMGCVLPLRVLRTMNRGEETSITTAAIKALTCSTLLQDTEPQENSHELIPRFEIVCITGPIETRHITAEIVRRWEKESRGVYSRTFEGSNLSREYSLSFSVNLDALLELKKAKMACEVISTGTFGTIQAYVYYICKEDVPVRTRKRTVRRAPSEVPQLTLVKEDLSPVKKRKRLV